MSDTPPDGSRWQHIFAAGGEMGAAIAAHDWSTTPLGPIDSWPQSLRTAVTICLHSRFPILLWWGDGLVMLHNDAYVPILGASKRDALGRPGAEVWPEIWDVIGPMLTGVLAGRGATWNQDQLLLLDRFGYVEECYFTFSYSPIIDESGMPGGVFTAVTETTERVVSDRRLRLLTTLGAALVDVTEPDEVLRRTAKALAGSASVPFVRLYQAGPDGLRLVAGDDAEPPPGAAESWPLTEVLADGQLRVLPLDPADDPDRPGVTRVAVLPVPEPGGDAPTVVLVAGFNPRRPVNADYLSFMELLAGHLGTALAGARAYQAEHRRAEALAELDAAKSAFFANVSHELRTPLTLIAGPVRDALTDPAQPLPPELRRRLELVDRNAARLHRLVDGVLDFSRLEAGRLTPEPVALEVGRFTRELAAAFAPAVERAGLAFEVDCPRLPRPAYLDRGMWEQIVLNLLTNAVKATLRGSVRLRVADDDGWIRLTVSDTGVGIPADQLPRLFQRFHRVTGPTGRSAEGTGIGLALVRELVTLHGGTVEAESEAGAGATFTVRLPYGSLEGMEHADRSAGPSAAAGALAAELVVPAAEAGEVGPAGRPRILLVDDNADLRAYVTDLLAPQFRVRAAADGRAALADLRADPPDLVLADVMMPVLDGFGLLAAVRADPATAHLPVVLLSARAGPEAAVEGLAAGADDYLVKPFSASELRARIQANLDRARARLRRGEWANQVIESLTDGVWIADENGVIVQVDETFERLTGYGAAGLPYPPPYPWWPDRTAYPQERALLDRALVHLLDEHTGAYEVPFQRPDGRMIWVSVSAIEVPDPDHDRTMLVGTVRDVTAERAVAQRHRDAAALADRLATAGDEAEVLALVADALGRVFGGVGYLARRDGAGAAYTAAGPVDRDRLDPAVAGRLAAPDANGDGDGEESAPGVGGRLSTLTGEWKVWVAFPARRPVRAEERLLGGLLTAAGSQALRRLEAVRQQDAVTEGLRDAVREATERERAWQAEAAARAEQRRTDAISRALLDSAPVGFGLVDTELRYVQVNPALAAMNQVPAADHLGRRPTEVLPEHGARIERLMRRALAGGPVVGVDFSAGPPETARRLVASYFPIRISDTDELLGLGFSVVDVTERTRLLEALGAERARYERLAATDVLAVFGGEGERITEANEAFLALLGHTREDIAQGRLTWPAITPPGWEEADERALTELAETGRARAYAKEYRHADGHRVPVQIGVVALDQRPLRWLAYALDLSAERAAQAELRLFQALVERSGDFIAVAAPDGRAVYVNPAGRALVGLGDTDRVDGLALVDFAAPDVRERWRTELIPTALRAGHHRAESRLARLDTGEQLDVDHQTFTVTTGDGRDSTAFVATVARDVSDRQRALRQAEALGRLAGALSSARGRSAIVDVVTTVAPAVVDAAWLRMALARPGATRLDVAGGDIPPGQLPVDADEPLARAVRENTAFPLAGDAAGATGVCLPLRYGDGGALGALEVRWARPVTDDEALRNLLDAVAGLCSQALQRAELTGSAQAMAEFAARLSVTRSTSEAIDVILDAAPTALGAVLPGLAMRDEGRLVRLWYHEVPESLAATFTDLTLDDPRPVVRALHAGERVILRNRGDFAARFPGLPDPVGAHGVVTTVALPLFDAQRQPIAALGFGWYRERPLREGDLALLDTIADLCEQTLERVRLAAAEHNLVTRLAGRLRSSALTTPDGLEIATRYEPAMTGLHLGGDWYDLVRRDDDRLAVVVGDVVGHQVEAAADMAQLRTVLNTLIRLGVPLEELFLRLTGLLGVGFLGTCLIVVVEPANRVAHVLRAGHPHPVLLPAGQEPRAVSTPHALPLGMVDAPMGVTTVPFGPGDLLVAYTDGLVERRGQPYDEGVAALHRALVAVRDEPAEAIADALLRDLPATDDDRALVVLRHTG
ncbi:MULTISPECIES: PAS domain S-box protein [Micromonospora]|uniref:PAS domain S-box protein n=1 Tax=Micromonospora TaxID=1873 RepID=UPI00131A33B2|nr:MULTISPECIES: PAS domain S-box protein [Micromonospora]NES12189.1 PAS domain S-box protein [Micromonospora sp. PPF5-17B]NES37893.1 PAS domain S-box protein [Micromonospora solifontis]NES54328.1 PAS domain S-box protein [Micromonospora sp. PPF5-6]